MNAVARPEDADRYAQMAARSKRRLMSEMIEEARAEMEADLSTRPPDSLAYGPPLRRDDDIGEDRSSWLHVGHWVHTSVFHMGTNRCSCGAAAGGYSFLPISDHPDTPDDYVPPDHCWICRTRGIEDVQTPAASYFRVGMYGKAP